MSTKLDIESIRAAAAGRWVDVLQAIGGMAPDQLDPARHGPCPKCGGEDRFRAFDDVAQTGGVICNQCHAEKNGDGFATIGWLLGLKFTDAVRRVAEHLGVQTEKGDADPAKDLVWQPWSSDLVAFFCAAKPPVTEESLVLAGARLATYKRQFSVIAIPIIGQDLDASKPVGWCLYNYNGGMLPKWNKQGDVVGQVKVKIAYGSKPGLVGRHAIECLKTDGLPELVWKVEGLTDLLALQAAIPERLRDRHLVVTNANGAGEVPRWPATVLAKYPTCVVHDADQPGQGGAEAWSRQIAAQAALGIAVRNVRLPYEIAEKHGKDLRDFFGEGRTYDDLLLLSQDAAPLTVARTEAGEVDYSKVEYPDDARLLKKLQLEVLYEDESGAIRVFSTLLRKSSTIRDIERLKINHLTQACGPPVREHIVASASDAGEDQWTMQDVRRALSMAAASRRGKNDERGIGVWQGLDEQGNETETVVLAGNTEGARWNGDKVLRRIIAPRADGLVLDFGAAGRDWYQFDSLERMLGMAGDVDWRRAAVDQAVQLFGRWRWRTQDVDPTLVAGLVLATWIQTVWDWRPLVAVSGESNSGKSLLFEALGGSQSRRGIFGALAFKQAKSTAAGIMQGLGNTARIALCDEFEASRERTKILEALRQSTRGETTAKGGAHHRGVEFVLRHIGWVAAIETGLQKQPDANRFIQLELLTAAAGQHGRLRLPGPAELVDLGQRLLAIAVRCAIEAKRLAVALKDTVVEGVDPRTVESYSVPAAILAVAEGHPEDVARGLLVDLLGTVDRAEQGRIDQHELLDDILSASVHLDGKSGVKTVTQVLESPTLRCDYGARLEAAGVRLLDDYSVFLAPKLVSQHLLRGGPWEGQKIDQLLLRLPGAERRQLRIGGRHTRGLTIPRQLVGINDA